PRGPPPRRAARPAGGRGGDGGGDVARAATLTLSRNPHGAPLLSPRCRASVSSGTMRRRIPAAHCSRPCSVRVVPTDPINSPRFIPVAHTRIRSTTVLGVLHNGKVALGSDGQATMKDTVLKHNVKKVRALHDGTLLAGFAGATADAFTLFERFESKLQSYGGNVTRAAVELAKDWRTDRYLRRLEALLAVASPERLLLISGTGDVIEPDDNVVAIGSGAPYALAAA